MLCRDRYYLAMDHRDEVQTKQGLYRWDTGKMGCNSLYLISIANNQTVSHLYSSCPVCTSFYSPCPDSTTSSQPMASQYTNMYSRWLLSNMSLQPMSSQYPISTRHIKAVLHVYSTHPDSTQYLKHMSNQYSVSIANVQTVPHLYNSNSVSILSVMMGKG